MIVGGSWFTNFLFEGKRGYKEDYSSSIVSYSILCISVHGFPILWQHVIIGDRYFRDCATGANNLIDDVWVKAENIWNDDEEVQLHDIIDCLLSIGTGNSTGMKPLHEKS